MAYTSRCALLVRNYAPNTPEKVTLLAIAMISNEDGSNCYAKVSTIANTIGKSIRTVKRHLRKLEAQGLLTTIHRGKQGYSTDLRRINLSNFVPAVSTTTIGASELKMKTPKNFSQPPVTIEEENISIAPETEELIRSTMEKLQVSTQHYGSRTKEQQMQAFIDRNSH